MLYRAVAAVIVVFWVTMTALLVRKEFAPQHSALREVPVSHVMKLMFQHEQSSTLHLQQDKQRVGYLQLQPQVRKEDQARLLDFSGNLQLNFPGLPRQRLGWSGQLQFDRAYALQQAAFTLNFREPTAYAIAVTIDPRTQELRYETRSGDRLLTRGQYSLDQNGAQTWLREQGLDPAMLQTLPARADTGSSFKAWQSSLQIQGHKLDTYRVAFEHSGQTLLEYHVNQLGQILEARTSFGYTGAPDEILP